MAPLTNTLNPSPESTQTTPTRIPGEILLLESDFLRTQHGENVAVLFQQTASQNGMVLRRVESDLESAMSAETRLVFVSQGLGSLSSISSAYPEVGFILLADDENEARDNVFIIEGDELRKDELGFVAGYIAALITPDYRVGAITSSENGPENAAKEGFLSGVEFYCGLCRPTYPPYYEYPQSEVAPLSEPDSAPGALETLQEEAVSTVYLSPDLNNETVYSALAGTGVKLIGHERPVDDTGVNWVASIRPDLEAGVGEAIAAWLDGTPGAVIESPVGLFDIDESVLSPGKVEHIEELIFDLASGRVDTATDPLTGAPR